MRYLGFAWAGLVAAACLPAALGGEAYYGGAFGGYAGPHYAGYSAGCESCGVGHGYGFGWGVPGCCDRPISGADHLWDGYCSEKGHGWGLGHCNECDDCNQHCGQKFSLFKLFGHKHRSCGSCNSCTSCTANSACTSCTGGGVNIAPAPLAHPAVDASGQEPPAPPQPPTTGRLKTRRAL